MNRNTALILLALLATACRPASPTQEISTAARTPPPSTGVAPVFTPSRNPMATATVTPQDTATPLSLPGAMSHDQLQERVNDWIEKRTPFDDSDRLLYEITAEEIRLGLLVEPVLDMVIFNFYNLGFTVVEGEDEEFFVINVVGFEDGAGEKFTFPFHNGRLLDECRIIQLQLLEGRRVNHHKFISFGKIAPNELLQRSEDLIDRVNGAISFSGAQGRTGDPCVDYADHYYDLSEEITNAFIAFLECADCEIWDAGPVLSDWINMVPDGFDPRIPYLRIYNVSYW